VKQADYSPLYWLLPVGVLIVSLVGYFGYLLYPRFGLPAVDGASILLLAAAAGIASFFSPCSFPLLVTLLSGHSGFGSGDQKTSPSSRNAYSFAAALALGAALFLILSGLVISFAGETLFAGVVFDSPAGRIIRGVVGAALIFLGLMQTGVLPFSMYGVEKIVRPLMRSQARIRRQRPFSGFMIFGFGYLLAGFG
jgi:cytochrome c biogenesis protein CcdA